MTVGSPPVAARRGAMLAVSDGAHLLGCVKCNAEEVQRYRVRLRWHPQWVAVLLLSICVVGIFGLLLYAIVAMAISRRVTIEVGLCREHRSIRRRRMGIGVAGLLLGAASVAIALGTWEALNEPWWLFFGGAGVVLLAAIELAWATPILKAASIEHSIATVKGCSEDFLASLAPIPVCATCGYDLRGLEGDELRCPECGTVA